MFTILLDAGVWSERDLLKYLGSAVMAGEAEIVQELLLRGADPSLPLDEYQKPCFLEALVRGHNVVVDILLADPRTDHNVRFNDRIDIQGTQTALHEAAKKGKAHMVRSLLEKGACARPNVETPMHSAVINRSPEIVQLLNRDDVDPNALYNGKTPLYHAMSADHEGLVKLLLIDKRVDANLTHLSNGRAPLHDAVILNNDRIAEYLLAAGVDAQIMDRDGLSPAMLMQCSAQARKMSW